jgi:hypothetical protein
MFPMIFQKSMGLGKSRCDVPNGTTQWNLPLVKNILHYYG